MTRYNIPYLIDKPGSGNTIHGEVYEVDENMLKNLDILEDHPNYYQRRPEKVFLSSTDDAEGSMQSIKFGNLYRIELQMPNANAGSTF